MAINGGGGAFFNAEQSVDCLAQIARAHGQFGSTANMPTLITDDIAIMRRAADAVAEAVAKNTPGILGVHFEGPHLSLPKKGTHSEQFIRPISNEEFAIYERDDLGIKMVTLAPENVSAADIKRLVAMGVKVSLGHTNADYETTMSALDAGADGFTHLFNAMSAFTSREPGVVGAALWHDSSWCGLIVDGHHLHPDSAKLAIRTKQRGKIMLVTDAMPPVGTDAEEFDFFDGRKVYRTGDRLIQYGRISWQCVGYGQCCAQHRKYLDISLAESLRMASLYPAQYLGSTVQRSTLNGFDADFVALDEHQQVQATYIGGIRLAVSTVNPL